MQAASTSYNHDIDVIQKVNDVRFVQCPEPSVQDTDSSATGETNAGVSNSDDDDDDAVTLARNIESHGAAQLDLEGLEDEDVPCGPVETTNGTVAINSSTTRVFISVVRSVRVVVTERSMAAPGTRATGSA